MAETTFLDSLFSSIQKANQQEIEQNKKKLNLAEKRKRLQQIKKDISQFYTIKTKTSKRTTRWSSILNNVTYEIRYNEIIDNQQLENKFKSNMLQAYELTMQILADLGLIRSVRTTVTSISSNSSGEYSYFRFPNFELKADYVFLNPISSKRGSQYGLRLKQSEINVLKKSIKITEAEIAFQSHFNAFIKPFVEYEQHAINTTHWKINIGVLGETFENHLERASHNSIQDLKNNSDEHLGTRGQRWVLYRKSSGSDPFFTGPDTELSQVKNANASILSDLRTLINTIEGILEIVDEKGQLNRPKEDLKKIFEQANFKYSLSEDMYEDLAEQAPEVIAEILRQVLKEGSTKITLTKKREKRTTKKTYKIDEESLKLIGYKT